MNIVTGRVRRVVVWLALGLMMSLVVPVFPTLARDDSSSLQPDSLAVGPSDSVRLYLPLIAQHAAGQSPDGLWTEADVAALAPLQSYRQIIPQRYSAYVLNVSRLSQALANAPMETAAANNPLIMSLPMPGGSYAAFRVVESPMMEPALAAQFPDVKTYAAQGIDDPAATARLDWTPQGFHGMILSPSGTVFIDPYSKADVVNYISYYKSDFVTDKVRNELEPESAEATAQAIAPRLVEGQAASGTRLRTYRLAVAATAEYTQFQGGTVALAQAAIVTSINRVDGIYEREVAVRLVLVGNNNQIIYTTNPDPYTNGTVSAMINENQTNLDNVIGNGNYDIGHVFGTNSGGLAGFIGCVCQAGRKAQGATGSAAPINDPFDVDYVAHEMGHQFGARHTWNGTQVSCTSAQRSANSAFEPGSGSTIMGYAGICGTDNLQPNSNDNFHGVSIDDIVAYTTGGAGNNCPTTTNTGNGVPTANAGNDYTIPANTPFSLTGSGSDPDGDTLTYNWEEFDLGPAGPPGNPVSPPFFRSWPSTTNPSRTFPRLQDLVNNTLSTGEVLPSIGSTLTFRLTVRDNRVGGGGVNEDTLQVTVAGTAGPFAVTAPNTAVTWQVGGSQTVTWNVANTTAPPVSCPTVNLLLSLDGGFTYPVTLASGVPNNGSNTLTVPNAPSGAARVKVACANNIFFDLSNFDFTVKPRADAGGPYTTNEGTDVVLNAGGSSASDTYTWDFNNDGIFGDATGITPTFDRVGRDGVYPVSVQVTKNGISDVAATTVTVNNVAPSVSLVSDAPKDEGSLLTVNGVISDPGWLDPLGGTIDWGDGSPIETLVGTSESVRPDATFAYSMTHAYGDNGNYTVNVCGSDDDATTCASLVVQVDNVNPTATIDNLSAVFVNGLPTFIAHAGQPVNLTGRSADPGSDDLTLSWDWGDGGPTPDVSTPYLVNPPNPDPFPSPSVQPRDVTDTQTHPFDKTCLYEVGFLVLDDDGGAASDLINVIIRGNADRSRESGYWQHQFSRQGNTDFDDATLDCYLKIAGYMSTVFSELRDGSTIPAAYDVLFLKQNSGGEKEQFDRELMTAWLNFANGSIEYNQRFDTNGDGVGDASFAAIVAYAESLRLNPNATDTEIREQRQLLQHIK